MKSILQGIAIIFTLITSFLGNLYFLKGDLILSAFISCIIVVTLYFLIEQFIKKKSEISKNKFATTSILLWSLYILLSIPISASLIHFLNVEINEKSEIQTISNKKIANLNNMVSYYDTRVTNYLTSFSIEIQTKLYNYKSNKNTNLKTELINKPYETAPSNLDNISSLDPKDIASDMRTAKQILFQRVKDSVTFQNKIYKGKYAKVYDNWSRLQLNIATDELNTLLLQNDKQFTNAFANLTDSITPPFYFEINQDKISLNHPFELWYKFKPYWFLIIVFLFHLLILLPYFIEPVAGKYINTNKNPGSGGGIII